MSNLAAVLEDTVFGPGTETVVVDGQPREIEATPITCLVGPGENDVQIPTRREINGFTTIQTVMALTQEEWADFYKDVIFQTIWWEIWKQSNPDPLPQNVLHLQLRSNAVKHTVGLIIELFECLWSRTQPFIREVECHLHPREQQTVIPALALMQHPEDLKRAVNAYFQRVQGRPFFS